MDCPFELLLPWPVTPPDPPSPPAPAPPPSFPAHLAATTARKRPRTNAPVATRRRPMFAVGRAATAIAQERRLATTATTSTSTAAAAPARLRAGTPALAGRSAGPPTAAPPARPVMPEPLKPLHGLDKHLVLANSAVGQARLRPLSGTERSDRPSLSFSTSPDARACRPARTGWKRRTLVRSPAIPLPPSGRTIRPMPTI